MVICKHCGAAVNGSHCEYCGCEVEKPKEEESSGAAQAAYTDTFSFQHTTPIVELKSSCNKWITLLLAVFFGVFGAHRFYVGKKGTGILYFCTVAGFGFGYFIDIYLIITGQFKDANGLYIR